MIKEALTIGYEAGLEDAWECARKILKSECATMKYIFHTAYYPEIILNNSPTEAIAKIKEYEEQEKQTEEKTDKSCATCAHILDDDFCEIFIKGGYCEKHSEWTPKQTEEKTDKSCDDCRFADLQKYEFPCSACSASHTFRWEPRKGASE